MGSVSVNCFHKKIITYHPKIQKLGLNDSKHLVSCWLLEFELELCFQLWISYAGLQAMH